MFNVLIFLHSITLNKDTERWRRKEKTHSSCCQRIKTNRVSWMCCFQTFSKRLSTDRLPVLSHHNVTVFSVNEGDFHYCHVLLYSKEILKITESKKESNRSILYFLLRNPVLLFNISLYLNMHERNIYYVTVKITSMCTLLSQFNVWQVL